VHLRSEFEPGDPCDATLKPNVGFRDAVDGAFKTPTLRNIALTGPYFHNGSRATLRQVMEFYNRGGDRRGEDASNTSGFDHPWSISTMAQTSIRT
jgi:cytochrome c peroxidase